MLYVKKGDSANIFDYSLHSRCNRLLMMALKSRMVEFKTEDGFGKGYLASPEKSRSGVLVLHAWWGLNDFFKGFANRLASRSEEHTSELQSRSDLVCRLLLEKKKRSNRSARRA